MWRIEYVTVSILSASQTQNFAGMNSIPDTWNNSFNIVSGDKTINQHLVILCVCVFFSLNNVKFKF